MANSKKKSMNDAGGKPASPPVRAKVSAVGDTVGDTGIGSAPAKAGSKPVGKAASTGNAPRGNTPSAKSGAKAVIQKSPASGIGGIDTSGAAAAAARLLAAGLGSRAKGQPAAMPQSALFKQIKSGAAHPVDKHLSGFLDRTTPAGTKKLDQGHGRSGPQGHNQTIGGDASRINVPRRTGG
jgi:hypothetical protein